MVDNIAVATLKQLPVIGLFTNLPRVMNIENDPPKFIDYLSSALKGVIYTSLNLIGLTTLIPVTLVIGMSLFSKSSTLDENDYNLIDYNLLVKNNNNQSNIKEQENEFKVPPIETGILGKNNPIQEETNLERINETNKEQQNESKVPSLETSGLEKSNSTPQKIILERISEYEIKIQNYIDNLKIDKTKGEIMTQYLNPLKIQLENIKQSYCIENLAENLKEEAIKQISNFEEVIKSTLDKIKEVHGIEIKYKENKAEGREI